MSDLTFREAARADLEAIVGLLADDFLGETRESTGDTLHPDYIKAYDAIESDHNQLLSVVEKNGVVVGCLQLTFIPNITLRGMWRGHIEGVRIAASERGAGIGEAFFEWVIERCRERGCGMVQLTMNKSRQDTFRFYERLGFVATHDGFKLMLD